MDQRWLRSFVVVRPTSQTYTCPGTLRFFSLLFEKTRHDTTLGQVLRGSESCPASSKLMQ